MSDGYAVTINHVSRIYRRGDFEVAALRNIDLEVARGEFVGIMAPSGSGKTTLLNLIAGMDRPTSGRIAIGGEAGARASCPRPPWRRARDARPSSHPGPR